MTHSATAFTTGARGSLLSLYYSNNEFTPPAQRYVKEQIAMTLTADSIVPDKPVTLMHSTLNFTPCQPWRSATNQTSYIHYEPKKNEVTLGTNSDSNILSLPLTIEQYAWIIQHLEEEENVYNTLRYLLCGLPNEYPICIPDYSSVLGVIVDHGTLSLKYRLKHLTRRKRSSLSYNTFLLPKSLLLQAARYIPMTKPLPPPITDINQVLLHEHYAVLKEPHQMILKRYAQHISLCNHDLLLPHNQTNPLPSPPPSLLNKKGSELCPIRCVECSVRTGLFTLTPPTSQSATKYDDESVMFPISYIKYKNTHYTEDGHHLSERPSTKKSSEVDSVSNGSIHPHSTSSHSFLMNSTSESTNKDDHPPEKLLEQYGYVAVDEEEEEILVIFPGMLMSSDMFDNISMHPVEWNEMCTMKTNKERHDMESPWVLESALIAWSKCEMKVVTLLMRLCSKLPAHYKVVIIGYSLGGAVASLCASSLKSTQLLPHTQIEVYAYHPPRVGNQAFINLLHSQVNVTRITDHRDLMAHLPPRTAGLIHAGQHTVITPWDKQAYVLSSMNPDEAENILSQTFSTQSYDIKFHSMAWDIVLNNTEYCV